MKECFFLGKFRENILRIFIGEIRKGVEGLKLADYF